MFRPKKIIGSIVASALLLSTMTVGVMNVSAQGESPAQLELIGAHSTWKYSDTNSDHFGDKTTDFRSKDFNDSAWKTGPSPLGYPANETDNSTFGMISAGGTLVENQGSPNAYLTYYFRNSFTVTDIAGIQKLEAALSYDDGYVMYINGKEVDRMYIDGEPAHDTAANFVNEAKDATGKRTVDLAAYRQYLVRGENTIAVNMHNRDGNSSDIYFGMTLTAFYDAGANTNSADKTPKQVNVHMGDNPSEEVNITYTTVGSDDTQVILMAPDGSVATLDGESSVGGASKYYHKIPVLGLEPATEYHYTVGIAPNTYSGKFKTAPAKGSKDTIKFVYLADTQVSNATTGKALGATLAEVNNMAPDFVYLAGDITDIATDEGQWEQIFNNSGAFPTGGQDMFGNQLIAAIQGNHDNNTFNRHINASAQSDWDGTQGNIVYSFDYGPITFVMLNLESARSDATSRAKQKAYLEAAIADANNRGQWTAVGFHKSLYTGASHIVDSDVIDARKYWGPVFAELDVDLVLQGHDHVYSRGFVTAEGMNGNIANVDGVVQDPENIPMYMVGGHAGGLKWYSKVGYTPGTGDPLASGYSFLDKNSTDDNSDSKQEQVIVELEVSNTEVKINCWMFKYNTSSDTITTQKYQYDSLTIERDVVSAEITGPDIAVADTDDEITYTVAYNNLSSADAFDTAIEYDSDVLELVKVENTAGTALVNDVYDSIPGEARIITGIDSAITAEKTDVATFTFRVKKPCTVDDTTVTLTRADTVKTTGTGGTKTSKDVAAAIDTPEVTTTLYSYKKAADVNGDGKVTLADLSMALGRYQSTAAEDKKYDIDLSNVVDARDFVIISGFIAA